MSNAEERHFFAIVNPAAGGGRCGRLAGAALDRVRRALGDGGAIEVAETRRAGEATEMARAAYGRGVRNFLAVGGDGTSYEIVNGLFPEALAKERPTLGFLPLGTGNSFLRDFTAQGVEHTIAAIAGGSMRSCDVVRARLADGEIYYINLLSLGFPADVGDLASRHFKRLGQVGYTLAVFAKLAELGFPVFPYRVDSRDWERRPCLFLSFSNSKFTGGKMMIAPKADSGDGLIEVVHWAPIGKLRLIWNFPSLFTGTHIAHPLASRAGAERVEFDLGGPATAMVDGEILQIALRSLEILPGALDVIV